MSTLSDVHLYIKYLKIIELLYLLRPSKIKNVLKEQFVFNWFSAPSIESQLLRDNKSYTVNQLRYWQKKKKNVFDHLF